MKVLVTGVNGQLGYDVMNELTKRGHNAIGSDITESNEHFKDYVTLDITNKEFEKPLPPLPCGRIHHQCGLVSRGLAM